LPQCDAQEEEEGYESEDGEFEAGEEALTAEEEGLEYGAGSDGEEAAAAEEGEGEEPAEEEEEEEPTPEEEEDSKAEA